MTGLPSRSSRDNRSKPKDVRLRQGYGATVFALLYDATGGKGIRTPDFQLAKLALYQLSYAPEKNCGM